MKVFQHSAGGMPFAFRPVGAIFLSRNLESLAGGAPALMAAGHKPLIETFERDSRLEAARP